MREAEWLTPGWLSDLLEHVNGMSERKRKLFSCECCRRQWALLSDHQRLAVETVERYLATMTTEDDLLLALAVEAGDEQESDDECDEVGGEFSVDVDGEYDPLADYIAHCVGWQAASGVAEHLLNDLESHLVKGGQDSAAVGERYESESLAQIALAHDIFGNPFRPVAFDPAWRTSDAMALATGIYEERAFDRMPILADALQDAGCTSDDILNHLRDPHATHVRGCWAVDLVLGKE